MQLMSSRCSDTRTLAYDYSPHGVQKRAAEKP
jgi:hypothetical protein